MDLVGLDLMLGITKSLQKNLPNNDPYQKLDASVQLLQDMVKNNKKGKAKFYHKTDEGRQVYNLQSKKYQEPVTPSDEAIDAAKSKGLHSVLEMNSKGGRYLWDVLSVTLRYSASLIPEIANNIIPIDTAMKLGFNWRRGPFEMIDNMGNPRISGPIWFAEGLKEEGRYVPEILLQAAKKHAFYKEEGNVRYQIDNSGNYQAIEIPKNSWKLADITRGKTPIIKNNAARLWDIGDGIACLELTTKMDIIDNETFDLVEQAIDKVKSEFKGLVIGGDDRNFSAGLNLKKIIKWCDDENWDAIEDILK